ncbi:MAG: alpha/beta hydrolase [Ramlibacter sp.]
MARRTGLLAAIAALVSGCSATAALNALVPANTYEGREGVPFGAGPRQRLDVYRPLPGQAGAPPIVVFFYGGNWESGERENYRFVGEFLAASGAIALIPDYRLYPQVRYPDFLKDCAAAVAWAFANAKALGGDPSRIYVMGHSAGAYNAAMMALDPRWLGAQRERLAGFVGIAGPYDFLPIENPATRRAFNWPDTPRDSQPVEYVSFKAPRTLLIAANKDKLVDPVRNTLGLARRLKAAGVDTAVRLLDGASHVTVLASVAAPLKFLSPVRQELRAFLGLSDAPAK